MNNCILSGTICKGLKIFTQEGKDAIVSGTLAVKKTHKNRDGEYETQFIPFVAYNSTANYASKCLQEGDKAVMLGEWNTRQYTKKDGNTAYVNELVVSKLIVFPTSDR